MIVNTDADNQYEAADIPKLVGTILRGEADMVIGDRQVDTNEHFSHSKRRLQRLGSWVVRQASSTEIPDTTSGFRAYNREAALQVQAVSKFTYTLETIIQAGKLLVAVDHVPIRTNPKTRESRLFPSTPAYVRRNALSIFRIYSQYEPLKVFWGGAMVLGLAALAIFIRFLVFFVENPSTAGRGHVQSLIAGAVLFIGAMLLGSLGVIGDLLAAQRTLSQRTFERVRRIELAARDRAVALRARPGAGWRWDAVERVASAAEHAGRRRPPQGAEQTQRARDPRQPRTSRTARRMRAARATARRSAYDVAVRPGRCDPDRQYVRQVRIDQPGRPAVDGRLGAFARRAVQLGPRQARCSTSAAAKGS